MFKRYINLFFVLFLFVIKLNYVLCPYTECASLTDNNEILSYCKNDSSCYIKDDKSEYSSIICLCKKIKGEYFFAGPDCSIKIPYHYKNVSDSDVRNTCWLEDLFSINAWKNEESKIGKICVNPTCN
ncbi:conserved protein, unknown function [Hepatocystis sp. ex Piliocolobus tephrosceles]|nr:conserved protein, unknown function [Hepatocystis sp. ex Piliocolobus tephrosceles]